jgi:acylphosphatase
MEDLITRRYLVTGRVQGVGYRYFVERAARELTLRGWVRNLTDGRVECNATGRRQFIDQFEQRLRAGPRFAAVRTVTVEDLEIDDTIEGFYIR